MSIAARSERQRCGLGEGAGWNSRDMRIGYFLAGEEVGRAEPVAQARAAERSGSARCGSRTTLVKEFRSAEEVFPRVR